MHTPANSTPTAKCRQTCTHPGTVNAIKTCNAAIYRPWTHLMIANKCKERHNNHMNKNWVLLEGFGEQVGFQL